MRETRLMTLARTIIISLCAPPRSTTRWCVWGRAPLSSPRTDKHSHSLTQREIMTAAHKSFPRACVFEPLSTCVLENPLACNASLSRRHFLLMHYCRLLNNRTSGNSENFSVISGWCSLRLSTGWRSFTLSSMALYISHRRRRLMAVAIVVKKPVPSLAALTGRTNMKYRSVLTAIYAG